MQRVLNYILIFLVILLSLKLLFPAPNPEAEGVKTDLTIQMVSEFTLGETVLFTLANNTAQTLKFPSECPNEPFQVSEFQNGVWADVAASAMPTRCEEVIFTTLAPNEVKSVNYQPWQKTLFTTPGTYRITVPVTLAGVAKTFQHDFAVVTPGFFGTIWERLFYQPIYNLLIFLTKITPGHSFGWGIILLTFIIRLVLFIPFQKSLRSQREMAKIQPELDALKKKYADNQQMLASETMALFKRHKVSPFGSCLPLLIQMPFLFALFIIVRDGLGENNILLLYSGLRNFDITLISTDFFGLKLLAPPLIFLPITIALLQFAQMKLALYQTQKKHKHEEHSDKPLSDFAAAMKDTTKYMQYIFPVLIGVFTISLPTAVGLYWGVSTLFSIGQQIVVNRQMK